MNKQPRPPYCLSRQHPELASRSQGLRGPLVSRNGAPGAPPAVNTSETPESQPRKGL
jgi:hypothetical protein